MKAILEFELPEDDSAYYDAYNGTKLKSVIRDFLYDLDRLENNGVTDLKIESVKEMINAKVIENDLLIYR